MPGITQFVGSVLANGRKLEDLTACPDRIFAVTPKQIQEATRAVLIPDRSVTGTISKR